MNDNIQELLENYHQTVSTMKEALKEAGLSEREVIWNTVSLPSFDHMLPEDVLNFYREIKVQVIIYLHSILKLSTREIERRLKGESYSSVQKVIADFGIIEDPERASIEEVSQDR